MNFQEIVEEQWTVLRQIYSVMAGLNEDVIMNSEILNLH